MRVLITGGSGFLGRRIVAAVQAEGHQVFAPRSAEFNLESGAGVRDFFAARAADNQAVEAVIHSAAYKKDESEGRAQTSDDPTLLPRCVALSALLAFER